MGRRNDDAYVLGTQVLGEADVIVTLLAENSGRVRGVAPSARRSRRRFGGALDPLTRVRAAWTEREGRELHRIESLDLARSYAAMQSEPVRQAACAVLAELAASMAREGQPDPKGFRLLGALLDAIEQGLDPWTAIRYFEYWTLRLHGVLADLDACPVCGRALAEGSPRTVARGGAVRCSSCDRAEGGGGRSLGREDLAFLAAAARTAPTGLAGFERAARPGGALEALLRGGVESFAERRFKTYRHLAAAAHRPGEGTGR
ncbi:MAG: DNA repair protein RecO [Acidobacteriia bacterium]|nr:DNA repair protein RecO [Terriglobia bacterium]